MPFSRAIITFIFLATFLLIAPNSMALLPDMNAPDTTDDHNAFGQATDANIHLSCYDPNISDNNPGTGCFATYYRVDATDSFTAPYPEIWIAKYNSGIISRFSPVVNAVIASFNVSSGFYPRGIAVDSNANVWVANSTPININRFVSRINPLANKIDANIYIAGDIAGIAVDSNANVWVAGLSTKAVYRISPQTNSIVATVNSVGVVSGSSNPFGPWGIAVDSNGNVWTANYQAGTVSRINPLTNNVDINIRVGTLPMGIAVDSNGGIWVANSSSKSVSHINPSTNKVDFNVFVGTGPFGVAVDANQNVWVTNSGSGTVSRINPLTNNVDVNIRVGSYPQGIAIDSNQNVWVVNAMDSNLYRINPKTNSVDLNVSTGGSPVYSVGLGDFTGFALQNFVLKKGWKPGSSDASGWKPDSNGWRMYGGLNDQNILLSYGNHKIEYYSIDKNRNIEAKKTIFVSIGSLNLNASLYNLLSPPKDVLADTNFGIRGTITAMPGGLPSSGATVTATINSVSFTTQTDQSGNFDLNVTAPHSRGDHNLSITALDASGFSGSSDTNVFVRSQTTDFALSGNIYRTGLPMVHSARPGESVTVAFGAKPVSEKATSLNIKLVFTDWNYPSEVITSLIPAEFNYPSTDANIENSGVFGFTVPAREEAGYRKVTIRAEWNDQNGSRRSQDFDLAYGIPDRNYLSVLRIGTEITFNSIPLRAYLATLTDVNLHVYGENGDNPNLAPSDFRVWDQDGREYPIMNFSNEGNGNYFFRIRMPARTGSYTFNFVATESPTLSLSAPSTLNVLDHSYTVGVRLGNNYQDYNFYVPGYVDRKISSVPTQSISAFQNSLAYYLAYSKATGSLFAMVSKGGTQLLDITGLEGLGFLLDFIQPFGSANNYYFVLSRGARDTVAKRIPEIIGGAFLDRISPAFGFESPDFQTVTSGLDYGDSEISIANDLDIRGGGEYSLVIRNLGRDGNRAKIGISRS